LFSVAQQRLGEWLVKLGSLRSSDVDRALSGARRQGRRFGSHLVQEKLVSEAKVVEALSSQLGVPGIDLSSSVLACEQLGLIPREVAEIERILPLRVVNQQLLLAMAEPTNARVIEEVQLISGMTVLPHVAVASSIEAAITAAYEAHGRGEKRWAGAGASGNAETLALQVPSDGGGIDQDVVVVVHDDHAIDLGDDEGEEELVAVSARPGKRLVLVVDDEEEILTLLSRALSARGLRVEQAKRGNEALQRVAELMPDLILLDANLPEIHGFEICKKLKASPKFARIPVILMTAVYRGWRFAHDSREAFGASDYIEKPFRLDDLFRRVEHHLSKAIGEPNRSQALADRLQREGVAHLDAGRVAEAVDVLRQSVEADGFNARAYFQLGRALQAVDDGYGAISAYERCVDLKPDHFASLRALAALYQQKGFRRKAIEAWERAIPAAPDEVTRQKIKTNLMQVL
jgi:DNA-binding response OmpR family regulator